MSPGKGQDYNKRVMRVLLYIQQHLDEALSLDILAEIAHVSPYYFHRLFRGMVGEPVLEHVRRLRLERAALHLKSTERPISQIAFDAGYETHEAFTRAFNSFFSCSPSNYRIQNRIVPKAPSPSGVHYNQDGWVESFTPLTEGISMKSVKVVERDELRVAFVRHIGPYEKVHTAWDKLCGWAAKTGRKELLKDVFGLCHDDPDVTDSEKIRFDACLVIGNEDIEQEDGIDIQVIEKGTYGSIIHEGPYEGMNTTYAAFMQKWLPESGYQLRDTPSLNCYLNNPDKTPPDQLRTEILIPIKKK